MSEQLTRSLTLLAERGSTRTADEVLAAARVQAAVAPPMRRGVRPAFAAAAVLVIAVLVLALAEALRSQPVPVIDDPVLPTPVVPEDEEAVPGTTGALNDVSSVAVAPNGALWAATAGGVVRWDVPDGEPRVFGLADGLPSTSVRSVAVAGDGTVWVAGRRGWVASFRDGDWQVIAAETVPELEGDIGTLAVGEDGDVWIAVGADTLLHGDGAAWDVVTWRDEAAFTDLVDRVSPWARSLAVARDGTVWASVLGDGVAAWNGQWRRFTAADGLAGEVSGNLAVAPDGTVWVASEELVGHLDGTADVPAGGVARFDGTGWTAFTTDDGLLTDRASITIGPDGTVWAVHTTRLGGSVVTEGLSRYDGSSWATYPGIGGLWAGAVDGDGVLWMPGPNGLVGFDGTDALHLAVDAGQVEQNGGDRPALTLTPEPDVEPVRLSTAIGELEFTTLRLPGSHRYWDFVPTPHGLVGYDHDNAALRWSTDGRVWQQTSIPFSPSAVVPDGDELVVLGRGAAARYVWNDHTWILGQRLEVPSDDWLVDHLVGDPGAIVVDVAANTFHATDGVHFTEVDGGPDPDSLPGDPTNRGGTTFSGGCGSATVVGMMVESRFTLTTDSGFLAVTPAHPGDWYRGPMCEPVLWESVDGRNWELRSGETPFGDRATVVDIAQHDGRAVAVGEHVWASDDGLTWTLSEPEIDSAMTVAAGDLGWVVLTQQTLDTGSQLWVSPDGSHWDGPYRAPWPLSGELFTGPTRLAVGEDLMIGIGFDNLPVIGRLVD